MSLQKRARLSITQKRQKQKTEEREKPKEMEKTSADGKGKGNGNLVSMNENLKVINMTEVLWYYYTKFHTSFYTTDAGTLFVDHKIHRSW